VLRLIHYGSVASLATNDRAPRPGDLLRGRVRVELPQ
jgi:hypothetical protein